MKSRLIPSSFECVALCTLAVKKLLHKTFRRCHCAFINLQIAKKLPFSSLFKSRISSLSHIRNHTLEMGLSKLRISSHICWMLLNVQYAAAMDFEEFTWVYLHLKWWIKRAHANYERFPNAWFIFVIFTVDDFQFNSTRDSCTQNMPNTQAVELSCWAISRFGYIHSSI